MVLSRRENIHRYRYADLIGLGYNDDIGADELDPALVLSCVPFQTRFGKKRDVGQIVFVVPFCEGWSIERQLGHQAQMTAWFQHCQQFVQFSPRLPEMLDYFAAGDEVVTRMQMFGFVGVIKIEQVDGMPSLAQHGRQ